MNLLSVIRFLCNSLLMNYHYLKRDGQRYKSVVEKYPDTISGKAPDDMFANFRGYVRNDLKKCTGCSKCIPICPVKALDFKAENRLDGSINVQEFRINLGKCFSCGACIEICPETSLFYSKEFELVSNKPNDMIMVLYGQTTKDEKDITRIRTYEVRR